MGTNYKHCACCITTGEVIETDNAKLLKRSTKLISHIAGKKLEWRYGHQGLDRLYVRLYDRREAGRI